MKATFVTLAVAGLAAAQSLEGLSPCIKSCIMEAADKAGCTGTGAEYFACLCKPETQSKLVKPVTECATNNQCDTADLLKAQSIATEQCKSSAGSATGSATGAPSGSASATGSSTAAAVTTMITGTGGVPTNSRNNTATSSSGATGTTKAPTTSHGGAGSATSGSGTVPTTTGAAAAGPVVGALAAVLAAALAL